MTDIINADSFRQTTHSFDFDGLVNAVKKNLQYVALGNQLVPHDRLFNVSVERGNNGKSLYEIYLDQFEGVERTELTCRTCQRWLETNGTIVAISANGVVQSAAFHHADTEAQFPPVANEDCTEEVARVMQVLREAVERSPISAYRSIERGTDTAIPNDGKFTHFHGNVTVNVQRRSKYYTSIVPGIENAAKESVRVMRDALLRWKPETMDYAYALADVGALRNHRFAKRIKQYVGLFRNFHGTKNRLHRDNLVWLWANTLTPDMTQVVGTVVGSLFDDLVAAGEDLALKRFFEQTDGINYQRPTTEPTVMELENAKKLVSENGWDRSFVRTAAQLEDIQFLHWAPSPVGGSEPEKPKSVFDSVKTSDGKSEEKPVVMGGKITLLDFMTDVVPKAAEMYVNLVGIDQTRYSFQRGRKYQVAFFTKAVHEDAPPILKWDSEEHRNHVASYVYQDGVPFEHLGVQNNRIKVSGITCTQSEWPSPTMKYATLEQPIFLLEGAHDTVNKQSGLFPEAMRHELHGSRRVIENYSANTPLENKVGVAGLYIDVGINIEVITCDGQKVSYVVGI